MNSWLLVLFAIVIGFLNKTMSFSTAAFILSFGSIQLIEYFLWSFPKLNSEISAAGLALIVSQPFFSILRLDKKQYLYPLLTGYAVFLFYSIYIVMNPDKFNITFSSTVASNGHLAWNWLPSSSLVFMILYMILLLTPLYLGSFIQSLLFSVFTLLFSIYTYSTSNTWGSMWCWFSSLASFGIIGKNMLISII